MVSISEWGKHFLSTTKSAVHCFLIGTFWHFLIHLSLLEVFIYFRNMQQEQREGEEYIKVQTGDKK